MKWKAHGKFLEDNEIGFLIGRAYVMLISEFIWKEVSDEGFCTDP